MDKASGVISHDLQAGADTTWKNAVVPGGHLYTARDILNVQKVGTVLEIDADQPLFVAARAMARSGATSVVVTERGSHVTGLISERDLSEHLLADSSHRARSKDAMQVSSLAVSPDTDLDHSVRLFFEQGFRSLPVLEQRDGSLSPPKPVGVVNISGALSLLLRVAEKNPSGALVSRPLFHFERYTELTEIPCSILPSVRPNVSARFQAASACSASSLSHRLETRSSGWRRILAPCPRFKPRTR